MYQNEIFGVLSLFWNRTTLAQWPEASQKVARPASYYVAYPACKEKWYSNREKQREREIKKEKHANL